MNQPITFNGTGSSDPDGDPLTYLWSFGDGGTATGATPTHTYVTGGQFSVTLTVTDPDGLSDSGQPVASGIYLLRLEAGGRVLAGRAVLLR